MIGGGGRSLLPEILDQTNPNPNHYLRPHYARQPDKLWWAITVSHQWWMALSRVAWRATWSGGRNSLPGWLM